MGNWKVYSKHCGVKNLSKESITLTGDQQIDKGVDIEKIFCATVWIHQDLNRLCSICQNIFFLFLIIFILGDFFDEKIELLQGPCANKTLKQVFKC